MSTNNQRHYNLLDKMLIHVDNGLRTITGNIRPENRRNPATELPETALADNQKRHIAGLMRINYAGEVSAQGLYQGQALVARSQAVKMKLEQAAEEENDHLAWCQQRINELQGKTSYLDPFWYVGSFCIGAVAGIISDRLSMGFLAETEYQVINHIDGHINQLPAQDKKTHAILSQMRIDEAQHATTAINYGATELPYPVKKAMGLMSKVMTTTAYWV